METKELKIADSVFKMIKDLRPAIKLDLINKISNSLKINLTEARDDSWKEPFGAWDSEESAEEIIFGIKEQLEVDYIGGEELTAKEEAGPVLCQKKETEIFGK